MFVCVATAQQNQAGAFMASTCNSTTSKPTPTTKPYIYETCIVAKFASYLSIGHGKYIDLGDGIVDEKNSTCDGVINGTVINPKLVVNFTCGQLEFEMERSNDSKIFVSAVNGYYTIGNEKPVTFSNSTPSFITTQSGHYYKCNSEQAIPLNTSGQLMLSNFAYEVFRTATGTDFYKIAEECALDAGQVSDFVRIGVGICLVALVVIVLIAYFVGRRRWSERSSYESV